MDRGRWKKLINIGWWSGWWVGGWMLLLLPAHPSRPSQRAVKRLLLFRYDHVHATIPLVGVAEMWCWTFRSAPPAGQWRSSCCETRRRQPRSSCVDRRPCLSVESSYDVELSPSQFTAAVTRFTLHGRPAQRTANWSFSSHSLILIEWWWLPNLSILRNSTHSKTHISGVCQLARHSWKILHSVLSCRLI